MNDMDSLMEAGKLRRQLDQHTKHAKAIVIHLNSLHYPGRPFVPAEDLPGLLSQIDSITQGMERKGAA